MKAFFLKKDNFERFLSNLSKTHSLFIPKEKEGNYFYVKYSPDNEAAYNRYRCVEPIKSFLTYFKDNVAGYFSKEDLSEDKPKAIFGLKNCDLRDLRLQDFVFKEGVSEDAEYSKRRENTLLISSDCTGYKEVCFCLAMGLLPYAKGGFDLNISYITNGFIVEVGSDKGEAIVVQSRSLLDEINPADIEIRSKKRENLKEELNKHLFGLSLAPKEILQKIVKEGWDSSVWKDTCLTCVECGACNFICGMCHCFLLADSRRFSADNRGYNQKINKSAEISGNQRLRLWDSCQYANFARVAGGSNPLGRRAKRLRNRFFKKFDFFPENLKMYACSGCGRCVETCPAKIDIREVLKDLYKSYSKI